MSDFVRIPATEKSRSLRRPIFGVGINDADYQTQPLINGKILLCPFYQRWTSMMRRCYSLKYHSSRPTYADCTVAAEWLAFSVFRRWMESQEWEGKELDKDVLEHGNRVYSPSKCLFVSRSVNSLLLGNLSRRGLLPQGVTLNKPWGKFVASISLHGKRKHLGAFTCSKEASEVYKTAKAAHIIEVAQTQPANIKAGLIRHAKIIENSP